MKYLRKKLFSKLGVETVSKAIFGTPPTTILTICQKDLFLMRNSAVYY